MPDISIEKNAQCQTNFAKTYKSFYPPQRHLFPICYDTSLFFPALLYHLFRTEYQPINYQPNLLLKNIYILLRYYVLHSNLFCITFASSFSPYT